MIFYLCCLEKCQETQMWRSKFTTCHQSPHHADPNKAERRAGATGTIPASSEEKWHRASRQRRPPDTRFTPCNMCCTSSRCNTSRAANSNSTNSSNCCSSNSSNTRRSSKRSHADTAATPGGARRALKVDNRRRRLLEEPVAGWEKGIVVRCWRNFSHSTS